MLGGPSRGTANSKAVICVMRPVRSPRNLLLPRRPLTSHTSWEEEEKGQGPTDPVTLTPSLWPTCTTSFECESGRQNCQKQR